jgi:long-chain acyl-CoA synthetase
MTDTSSASRFTPETALPVGMGIALHAQRFPERTAVASEVGERTYAQLNARCNQLVRALRRRGLASGDAIALVATNRPEFAETYFAALRSGLRVTPINWHLTAAELSYILDNCEAKAVIADARFAEIVAEAAGTKAVAERLRVTLAFGGDIDGFTAYDASLRAEPEHDIEAPELGTQMLYTSGTTGQPKGVYRRSRRGLAPGGGIGGALGYREADAHLCTGPLYHAAPLAFSLVGPLSAGIKVVMMDGWDPSRALELIEEHRITHTHMVPTMFHRLLMLPEEKRRKHDVSSLRTVLHGAAPCPIPVKQGIMEWLGPIVYEYYAATEGFGTLVDPHTWLARPGTVGKPAEGQVRVLDDAGRDAAPGEVGTVYLRAPEGARFEYYGDAEKTRRSYHGDTPYFTLGDMGYFDAEGFLFLSDRSADLIITGGVNVYPAEVDAVLLMHSAVQDTATVGVPNDDWGEEVRSVVVLRPGHVASPALAAELITFCRERLASFKCPRLVDFVSALPRYDTGKIFRRKVRERYWEGRGRSI